MLPGKGLQARFGLWAIVCLTLLEQQKGKAAIVTYSQLLFILLPFLVQLLVQARAAL